MWFVGLGALLLLMKFAQFGPVAGWSWWIVLAPFVCAIAWWSFADATGYYQRKAMEKMDRKKQERRLKNMDALGLDLKKKRRL